jgi:hypothetical protein
MEHILDSNTAGIDFTAYLVYVESIRQKLPSHVYSFASDQRYFDLSSHSSLHDAWLETLIVRETSSGKQREVRGVEITISLLGPFHDRRIHLHYTGVTRYVFTTAPRHSRRGRQCTAHEDLFTHEIRLGHAGFLVHELFFERGSTFLIECSDMRHSEECITNDT